MEQVEGEDKRLALGIFKIIIESLKINHLKSKDVIKILLYFKGLKEKFISEILILTFKFFYY